MHWVQFVTVVCLVTASAAPTAQTATAPAATKTPAAVVTPTGLTPPADYVIGPDDVLSIVFWRDKDMSADVTVRPDGMITLPLINDVHAAGLTPDQLRGSLTTAADKFLEEPNVTVVVKAINSRKVFVTGNVNKPGPYPLAAPTTVLQLIATAGGLQEYAKGDKIVIMRTANGTTQRLPFNYGEVTKGKKLQQNVMLQPGDTVIVP
jgi:polysaccharide export outer membrane protein